MNGSVMRLADFNKADFTALASFTSEASLLTGVSPEANNRPPIPAMSFSPGNGGWGRRYIIEAMGTFGVTGTPTYLFQVRLGTSTTWSASDTSVLQSAAITCGSGVSNQQWRLKGKIYCRTPGMGTGNCTIVCEGYVESTGFASPYRYYMAPSNGALQTLTATIDGALTQYVGLSVTCSASSASNTITCKGLEWYEVN